jgi:acetyl esterase
MAEREIDAIRILLGSKPRPVGWSERRQRLDEVGSTWPVASDVKCETVDCDGVAGEWSIVPGSEPWRVLLYFHGGGYCSGSIASHRRLVTEAGRAARTRTLAIDYRLAPEHPYPAAHEDALAAWRFLRRQGIAATDIAVGGDSAGGNLAAVVAISARDGNGPDIAGQVLIYPATDFAMTHPSHREPETSILLTHSVILWFRDHYLSGAADVGDWRASPARAKTLIGLPPAYVLTAGADPLRDEGDEYARRLKEAGVAVTHRTFPGQFHGFFTMGKLLQQANVAAAEIGVWLKALN